MMYRALCSILLGFSCLACVAGVAKRAPDDSSQLYEVSLASTEDKNWTLHYEAESFQDLKPLIEEALLGASAVTKELLDIAPPGTLDIVLLCPSTFKDSLPVQPWMDALHHRGRIFIQAPCTRPPVQSTLKARIIHEYVHAALYAADKESIPLWLNEGLAMSIEAAKDSQGAHDLLVTLAGPGKIKSSHFSGRPEDHSDHMTALAWNSLAHCGVRFLLEEYPDEVRKYLERQNPVEPYPEEKLQDMVSQCARWLLAS